ncbi:MAG: hypothetical protein K6B74_04385 [Ruminococcus sp.]|nr:hypothetical protein [Ruminococcus sp.]
MRCTSEMQAEHENVLLVDAGDAIQGTSIGSISEGEYIISMMNKVGYDAATLGNHEFDYSVSVLQKRAAELECGYICCNFYDKGTGQTLFDPYKLIRLRRYADSLCWCVNSRNVFKIDSRVFPE